MSKLDFGTDTLGQILNAHMRIEERFPGIYVALPYKEMPEKPGASPGASPRSPVGQVKVLVEGAKRGAALGFWKTVMWDTVTNTSYSMKNEFATQKVNQDDKSKHYTVGLGENFLFNVPGVNWRDNGMAQDMCYNVIRDGLLMAPEPFHLFLIGHETIKDELGIGGLDAGGPASAAKFPSGQFQAFFRLQQVAGRRFLMTGKHKSGVIEYYALLKQPPGSPRLACVNDKGAIEIKEGDFEASVEIHRQIVASQNARWFRCGLYGASDSGKSAYASAFLGLPDTRPCLVIMSDNQADLPSWWPQVKEAADTVRK